MPAVEAILIDTSIWIKGQRDVPWFSNLVAPETDLATCDAAVGEFAVGLHAPREKKTRDQVRAFYDGAVSAIAALSHPPEDFHVAARLIGEAIFAGKAKPSFADGLIAACALRTDRTVWTTDETDFKAMGCKTRNPWAEHAIS